MFKVLRLSILIVILLTGILGTGVQAASPTVVVVDVEGVINPVLADFVARGIEEAEELNATACILQLDTPGGLDTAMRDIVQVIVNSRVPVVVYVSPSGARAAFASPRPLRPACFSLKALASAIVRMPSRFVSA